MTLDDAMGLIQPVNGDSAANAQRRLDRLTKPLGSLGRLEELAVHYARITGDVKPNVPRGVVFTFAADHGVAMEGVSAYPSEVTPQMVLNFLRGGAGVNVLARHTGVEVRVVDIGVAYDFGVVPGLIQKKIMRGTNNLLREAAMTRAQATEALQVGIDLATEAAQEGVGLIGTGEMGIGNTTAAAALMHVLTGVPVEQCVGAGTGLLPEGIAHKAEVIRRAVALHGPLHDPAEVLATYGGFEIATMVGAMLEAAAQRRILLIDGFIVSSALLVAARMAPAILDYCVFAHCSDESGHGRMLQALGVKPVLSLGLRLGEGTGAALVLPLVQSAVAFLNEMATFSSAQVSEKSSA